MKHGELKEYIAAGTSKDDFLRRVSNAFNASSSSASAAATSSPQAAAASPQPAEATPQSASPPTGTSPESDRSENVARVLAERAARAEKEAAERTAKEAAAARQKAKGKAKDEPDAALASSSAAAQEQADIVKKKKLQASEERRRIMQRIENDKEARRMQAAEREQKRRDSAAAQNEASPGAARKPKTADHSSAAIQVRLLDGASIRSRFKASAPFKDVRKWVDQERTDEKQPYSFKQVLTPLPNKTIEVGEENQLISDLGLAPSANLLLIPAAAKFAVAYDDGASGNLLSRIIGMIMGFFTWILSLVGLGGQQATSEGQSDTATTSSRSTTSPAAAAAAARARRTRGPSDWQRDQQLYNGNSVSYSRQCTRYSVTNTFTAKL